MIKKLLLLTTYYLLFTSTVFGARLYFEPAPSQTEGEIAVAVKLDADVPVNVLETAVRIPDGVSFVRAGDGGSIVELWIEQAKYDAAGREVSFAAMIPGGFIGTGGKVLTLYAKRGSHASGEFRFVSEKTALYLNSPAAPPETAELASIAVSEAIEGSQALAARIGNGGNEAKDTEPPYAFYAAVSQNPHMFEGMHYIAFYAKDELSGILRYEVAEGSAEETFQYQSLDWTEASSPHILADQTRSGHIYVKAVDHAGNERIIVIPPGGLYSQEDAPKYLLWSIIIGISALVLVALALLFYAYTVRKHTKT